MAAIPLRSRDRDRNKGCLIVTANQSSALSEETTDNLVLDTAAVSISTLYNPLITNLSLETNQLINCIYLSQQDWHNQKTPLIQNIQKEGISV
jgi:hypothetical protein